MFTSLLIAILLCQITLTDDNTTSREIAHVYVHEWGVVPYDSHSLEVQGIPGDYFEFQIRPHGEEMVVRAPVVYFYGPEFTGSFSVKVPDGRIIEVYPQPDLLSDDNRKALWENLTSRYATRDYDVTREIETTDRGLSFDWAIESWRDVPAMLLSREWDGFEDYFLYYECTLDQQVWHEKMPLWFNGEEILVSEGFNGEVLVFLEKDGEALFCRTSAADLEYPLNQNILKPYDREEVFEILRDWAAYALEDEEILALWNTWESYIVTGEPEGCREEEPLVLYRMPDQKVEEISTINLETDQGYTVEYSRFFLGALSITM